MDDPNPDNEPWVPGKGKWDTGDRISAALINGNMQREPNGHIPVYSYVLAGLILAPEANRLLCSYPFDVGSLERVCYPRGISEHCVPGCTPANQWARPSDWCEDFFKDPWPCAWPPNKTHIMMQIRDGYAERNEKPPAKFWDDGKFYDELIFDAEYFVANLPHSITAFFFQPGLCGGDAYDGPKCTDYAIGAHRNFLAHYGLTKEDVPLLQFDSFNWDLPFTVNPDIYL